MRRRRTKVDMSDISGEPEAGGSIDPRAITGRGAPPGPPGKWLHRLSGTGAYLRQVHFGQSSRA
jgi:hypothetical protein